MCGEQGWSSGDSTRLPPTWPRFNSRSRRHTVCGLSLLLILSPAPRGFSPGTPIFLSPQNPTLPNSNSIWNARTRWTPMCYNSGLISFFFRSSPKINRMLYAYHKTHLHTTKVVMILIPSSQGLHYIGTPETMPDIACYISSVTSVNLKKAGMARRNIVIKKQYTLLWISFPVVFGLLISGRPTKKNACIFKVSLC